MQKIFTNCFLVKKGQEGEISEVCLAMKKRGFGAGMWNGSGGKPDEGEDIEDAARREIQEELGVTVKNLEKRGVINFILKQEKKDVCMHVFIATSWEGELKESEEMFPRWFSVKKVPYGKMWKSDREWLPLILSGKKIEAKYVYSCEGGEVEAGNVVEIT